MSLVSRSGRPVQVTCRARQSPYLLSKDRVRSLVRFEYEKQMRLEQQATQRLIGVKPAPLQGLLTGEVGVIVEEGA